MEVRVEIMKQYGMSVGYYKNIDEFELSNRSWRAEDDHYRAKPLIGSGDSTEDCARRFFESLIDNGGKIVRYEGVDPWGLHTIGIEQDGIVYVSADVWVEHNGYGYDVNRFYE